MFGNPSLTTRITIGKLTGLIFGLVGFFMIPSFMPELPEMMRWGFLLWYMMLGAIIGVFGVYTFHPILKFSLPWWFLGPWIGGWMNFILTLFIFNNLSIAMVNLFGPKGSLMAFSPDSIMLSPFWFVFEGIIFGLIVGYLASKFGGEGAETARN